MSITRNGGSHDGLYAARVYQHDRRQLLRGLRKSRGRRPVRSGSGFGGVTRSCRRAWPNGSPSGAGISPEAEKRESHDGLYAARVYRHDRRRLLRGLRESRGRRPVRSGSGFGGVTRSCRRAWPNGSPSGAGISPEAEKRGSHDGLYAARVYRHDRRQLLRGLRSPAGAVPFVPAAASAASPAPADEPGLTAVPAPTPAPAAIDEEIPTQPIPRVKMPRQQLSTQELADPGAADPGAVDAQKVDREKVDPAAEDTAKVVGEKELAEDEPDGAQDYRTGVEQAQLPDDVRKAALYEVGKLERTVTRARVRRHPDPVRHDSRPAVEHRDPGLDRHSGVTRS